MLKKVFLLLNIVVMTSAYAATNPLYAASAPSTTSKTTTTATSSNDLSGASGILNAIKVNTDNILAQVNKIPDMISKQLSEFIEFKKNMTQTQEADKKPPALVYNTQQNMDQLGQFFQYGISRDPNFSDNANDNIDAANAAIVRMQKLGFAASQSVDQIKYDENSFNPNKNNSGLAPILNGVPTLNNVTYTNAIGLPPILGEKSKDPAWVESFIQSASGSTLYHQKIPKVSPNITNLQKSYLDYFNLTYAVQSFNNYVMSKYLLKGDETNQQQSALYRKASNTDYLSSIATAPIGHVLRDILLFQSQNYVMTSKLLEVQKEILMSNVMTNALYIAANTQNESALYDKIQTS